MRLLFLIAACALYSTVFAQKVKTVEATYVYYTPENVSMEAAKQIALDRAKTEAIANEFGRVVLKSSNVVRGASNGKSDINMSLLGGVEVKGEWIETIGEPKFQISYEDNVLIVAVTVKGKAREIISAQTDLKIHVLRNGIEDKFESDQFRSGDDLYLSFLSPVKGYLAAYLIDADQQVFCLLPYRGQQTGIYPIEANHRYLFFNAKAARQEERSIVDEYTMTCERSLEHNQIYIVFSPNQFVKANDFGGNGLLPRQLSFEDFNKWLVKCRRFDGDMVVNVFPLTINNK